MNKTLIFVLAVSFFLQENIHFGWSATAQSDAKLIADGIVMILLGMAFLVDNK